MLIFAPLRRRPLAFLWGGQVLSSIGDEISKVAMIWLATQLWGVRAGYLAAVQAGSSLAFSLLGSAIGDRWSRTRTMIASDLARAGVSLLFPLAVWAGVPLSWVLLPAAVLLAGLSAFFEPALRASLPDLAPDRALLQATTALMEASSRLARLIGPATLALASTVIPMVHFFTLDAVTFLISAGSLAIGLAAMKVHGASAEHAADAPALGLRGAYRRLDRLLRYVLVSGALVSAGWSLVLPLGMALLVDEIRPGDVKALGVLVAAYGAGNLASNLFVGSIQIDRPERALFVGRSIAGLGFVALGFAPSFEGLLVLAAIAATGGPATDVGFLSLLQDRHPPSEVARIYRLFLTFSYGGLLTVLLASPTLFARLGVRTTIALAGLSILACGLYGLFRHRLQPVAEAQAVGRAP